VTAPESSRLQIGANLVNLVSASYLMEYESAASKRATAVPSKGDLYRVYPKLDESHTQE
jgi:hypothetical protein